MPGFWWRISAGGSAGQGVWASSGGAWGQPHSRARHFLSPLPVLRERVRVRVLLRLNVIRGSRKNPHPDPLREYREREERMRLPWGRVRAGCTCSRLTSRSRRSCVSRARAINMRARAGEMARRPSVFARRSSAFHFSPVRFGAAPVRFGAAPVRRAGAPELHHVSPARATASRASHPRFQPCERDLYCRMRKITAVLNTDHVRRRMGAVQRELRRDERRGDDRVGQRSAEAGGVS